MSSATTIHMHEGCDVIVGGETATMLTATITTAEFSPPSPIEPKARAVLGRR